MFKSILLTSLLILGFTVTLSSPQAQTNNRITIKGSFDNLDIQEALSKKDHFAFKLDYELQMWILMGEPVFSCQVKWNFSDNGRIKFVPGKSNRRFNDDHTFKLDLGELSYEPKLYAIQFLVPLGGLSDIFRGGRGELSGKFVLCYGGALGNAGKNNFTTPGSPSWSNTIFGNAFLAKGATINGVRGRFLKAGEAKKAYKVAQDIYNKMSAYDRSTLSGGGEEILVKADFNLNSYYEWMDKKGIKRAVSSKEENFWNGGDDPDADNSSTSKEEDFWNGGDDPSGIDPNDFVIKTINEKQGVSTKDGRILIPFRKWVIKSFKAGLATISFQKKREKSSKCAYHPSNGAKGGGWGYYIDFSEEGSVNSKGNWVGNPKKGAIGRMIRFSGRVRNEYGKYTELNRCKIKIKNDLESVLNKYRLQGYSISQGKFWELKEF